MSDFNPDPADLALQCAEPLPPLARRGVELFNQGEYFEAHELLEEAWRAERRPVREFYRVVLQAAVAYYKISQGNYNGALKMIARLRRWAQPFPPCCQGLALAALLADIDRVESELLRLGPERIERFPHSLFKPVRLEGDKNDGNG